MNRKQSERADGVEIMGKCPNTYNSETTKEENKIYFSLYLFSIYSSTAISTSQHLFSLYLYFIHSLHFPQNIYL